MPRKAVAKSRCALCGAKDISEPRGEEKYCRDCWEKKIAVEEIVAREFALKRYIRAHSAEKYLIYHSTLKRPPLGGRERPRLYSGRGAITSRRSSPRVPD